MNTRHFSQLPKPYLAYPKVIQGLIFKKPKGEKVLPQVEYVVDSFKVDQKHLKAYNASVQALKIMAIFLQFIWLYCRKACKCT